MPSAPTLDVSQALAWLRALAPNGPWTLVALAPDPIPGEPREQLGEFGPDTERELIEWITLRSGLRNIYYTSNVPRLPFTSHSKAATEEIRVLQLDVDVPGAADDPTVIQRQLEMVRSYDPPPAGIAFTGGGHQALWHLTDPLQATPEFIARIEAVNTAIWRAIGGDACHDVSRILRLPGTINVPNATKRARGRVPVASRIVELNWDRTWNYQTDPVPRLTAREENQDTAISVEGDGEMPSTSTEELGDLPLPLRKMIRDADAAEYGGDRSKLGWRVICQLVQRGWSDEAIRRVITNREYKISQHYLDQPNVDRAVTRNIANARARIAADWARDRTGAIMAKNQRNLVRALDEIGARFSYDLFANRAYVNGAGPLRVIDDDSVIELRLGIDDRLGFLPDKDLFHDVIRSQCRKGDYHPIRNYLDSLVWDGVPRIGGTTVHGGYESPGWLTTYGGAEDSQYTRAVGRLILLAAVRRIRQPGCKFDEMLVFINPDQGTEKSTALQILAKKREWFTDSLPLHSSAKQVIEKIAGRWIVECSELSGMRRADVEDMKVFLSTMVDVDRLAYDRYRTELPRQSVFFGTTNSEIFLRDDQNRRFWPVYVTRFDVAALARDVDQIWAEANHYEATGETIRLDPTLWAAAAVHQTFARADDPWAEQIGEAFGTIDGKVVNSDVWKILDKPAHAQGQEDNRRLGAVMRELGFERTKARVDGLVKTVYSRGRDHTTRSRLIYVFRDPFTRSVRVTHDQNPPLDGSLDPANELPT